MHNRAQQVHVRTRNRDTFSPVAFLPVSPFPSGSLTSGCFADYSLYVRRKKKRVLILLSVNVITFVHSESTRNQLRHAAHFFSFQAISLYKAWVVHVRAVYNRQERTVEKRSRNEHSHKWRSTRLHASLGTMSRINKAVAFASARKHSGTRRGIAPRYAALCRSRVLTRVIASPQSKPGRPRVQSRVTTVIEPAYTRHRGDRVQSVSWVRWTFADLSAVRPPPRRRCQRLSRGERGGPFSRVYTCVVQWIRTWIRAIGKWMLAQESLALCTTPTCASRRWIVARI